MNPECTKSAFELLQMPLRPWLDPERLKDRYHELAGKTHPDAGGDAAELSRLNAAYAILKDPAKRVRHLIEITFTEAHADQNPPELFVPLFMSFAGLKRTVEDLIGRKAASGSLAAALLAGDFVTAKRELSAFVGRLESLRQEALAELQAADLRWTESHAEGLGACVPALFGILNRLVYLDRWLAQCAELRLQLEF